MSDTYCTPAKKKDPILNIPASPFLKRLGYGTGVSVYQFTRSPQADAVRSPWAVKMLNKNQKNTSYGKRLREEAALLKNLVHPHIVGFRAFGKTNLGQECLAMENCNVSLGDLIETRLEENKGPFPPDKILRMGHHISKALDYLHIRAHLLHGDIKSHNILIVGDFEVCKLCDFGVSLPLTKDCKLDIEKAGKEAEYIGTPCWSAPEVIEDPTDVTNKTDIFSFGIVFWEMITLQIPHSLELNEESFNDDSNYEDYPDVLGTRPNIPEEILSDNLKDYNHPLEIFYLCTEQKPDDRPTAYHLSISIYEMIHGKEIK